MTELIDLFLHLDKHLAALVVAYGPWIYGLLFVIVFAETGLVVTPFLPGDSLLFAAGTLAGTGALNVWVVAILLVTAAILGDAVNYSIGRFIGLRVFDRDATPRGLHRFINREYLDRAHGFFERYGGKAVVIGRFVPIIRTFVPFVAGAVAMTYPKFAFYNVTGGLLWVGVCVGAGYAFGNVPVVQRNFSYVVLGIIVVSVIPVVVEFLQARARSRFARPARQSRPIERARSLTPARTVDRSSPTSRTA
jgi:membrane-associated protein